jgi:hypothetical protein
MTDVDLLVHSVDLARAREVLVRLGWRAKISAKRVADDHHQQFIRAPRRRLGPFVELHWRLSAQTELSELLPLSDLWGRSKPAPAPFTTARVFDLCDQLLHAVLHLAEHYGLPQLRWLCDVHELSIRIGQADLWDTLAQRAVQYDLHLVLAAALQEATRWFGTAVPGSFWRQLAVGLPPSARARAVLTRCREPELVTSQMQELRSIRTLRGKLAHILNLLFPDARVVRLRHRVPNGSAVWPYYVFRLGNGLRAGLKGILHRAPDRNQTEKMAPASVAWKGTDGSPR